MKRNLRMKAEARAAFGNACQRCGYSRCMAALHFHHSDDSEKYEWDKTGRVSYREVEAHPERFQLLCANCHYEVHAELDEASKTYAPCSFCGKPMHVEPRRLADGRDKYCSRECRHNDRSRIAEQTVIERFWSKVQKTDACWLWTGTIDERLGGYGVMNTHKDGKNKVVYAHRLSYEIHHGHIPKGSRLIRTCPNRHCVNPDHMRLRITT